MSLLDILIYVAATTFVVGWLVIILDAATGSRLIERIPSTVTRAFGAVHNGAFIAIAAILSAGVIWHLTAG